MRVELKGTSTPGRDEVNLQTCVAKVAVRPEPEDVLQGLNLFLCHAIANGDRRVFLGLAGMPPGRTQSQHRQILILKLGPARGDPANHRVNRTIAVGDSMSQPSWQGWGGKLPSHTECIGGRLSRTQVPFSCPTQVEERFAAPAQSPPCPHQQIRRLLINKCGPEVPNRFVLVWRRSGGGEVMQVLSGWSAVRHPCFLGDGLKEFSELCHGRHREPCLGKL